MNHDDLKRKLLSNPETQAAYDSLSAEFTLLKRAQLTVDSTRSQRMQVKRIMANIATADIDKANSFYRDILGLEVLMDHGWLCTYGNHQTMTVQISIASQGGSDTPVPDLSIEVDDVDTALQRCRKAGLPIEYGPVDEPWGVRRFYVRDPFGKLVNILQHQ